MDFSSCKAQHPQAEPAPLGATRDSKYFRVQRAREPLDGVHHARRRSIDGIADHNDVSMLHRRKIFPAGTCAQRVDVALRVSGMRAGENQNFRLKPDNFFQADVRPLGFRFHDRAPSCSAQRIRDERVAPHRNQRIGPHDKKHAPRRGTGETAVEIGKARRADLRPALPAVFSVPSALPRCSTDAIISSTE